MPVFMNPCSYHSPRKPRKVYSRVVGFSRLVMLRVSCSGSRWTSTSAGKSSVSSSWHHTNFWADSIQGGGEDWVLTVFQLNTWPLRSKGGASEKMKEPQFLSAWSVKMSCLQQSVTNKPGDFRNAQNSKTPLKLSSSNGTAIQQACFNMESS